MSLYSIVDTIQTTQDWVPARTQGFRVKVDLSAPVGFSDEGLFVFIQKTIDTVEFQAVASPLQLAEIPLGAPTDDSATFFRLPNLDMVFGSQSEGLEFVTDIQAELKLLCNEMAKLATDLTDAVTGTIASDT